MMPVQLFDSLCEAADSSETFFNENNPYAYKLFSPQPTTPRARFLEQFTVQDKRIDPQSSTLQALWKVNDAFLKERCELENNKALNTIATSNTTTARRIETLYMMVLARLPRAEETAKLVREIDSSDDSQQAVADLYLSLLNSSEFMLNH
jgi:hypothetical protein